MTTIISSTDSPESIKDNFKGKGVVTVSDDAGNDITPKEDTTQDSAAATEQVAENTTESATVEETPADTEKDKPTKAEKRIEELIKKVSSLEAQLKAAPAEKKPEVQVKPADAPAEDAEPKPEDFDTQADFLKALSKWAIKAARKEEKAETAKQTEVEEKQKVVSNWHEQQKAARAKYKDYDTAMGDTVIGVVAAKTLIELPDGAELAYYIGKHPEEAEVLAKLTKERDVAIALGELRAKVQKPLTKAPVQGKEKPKPITPLGGTSKGNVEKPRGELTYKEFKAKRQQEIAAKRKA